MTRFLVALDSSPRAPLVLATAAKLAEPVKARLVLFRAVSVQPELPIELLATTAVPLDEYLQRHAREDLQRLARDLRPDLVETYATAFATSWDGICRAAREYNVDLIVIGSHGFGGIDRLLGTTAAKVVNHADRNVLVVRARL